ncbi:hypothetical protein BLNAU_3732 [Blattamonas nauphoetae]|uniref:Uncharacterized protein n=1 Tax=Blattamonas nauphoetae TaxID=2049346 RepID=A0ABQ9YBZ4_9EUKA|nr:hypothetical protein BLNAU_3732 [Blattamonas nauphoetae]
MSKPPTPSQSTTAKNISAWGQLLYQYEKQRTAAPPYQPPPSNLGKSMRTKERDFDPVLQRFRDESKDQSITQTEMMKTRGNVERSVKNTKPREFNIVTNTQVIQGATSELPSSDPASTHRTVRSNGPPPRKVNIISNRPLDREIPVSTTANSPSKGPLSLEDGEYFRPKKPIELPPSMTRDYNIITNCYTEGNDEKSKADEEFFLKQAANSLYKQHRFDPIKQCYVNEKLEEEEKERIAEADRKKRERHEQMIPQSVKNRTERTYNPETLVVLDEAGYQKQEEEMARKREQRLARSGYSFEKTQRDNGQATADLTASRKLARQSYRRYEVEQTRGFNIVSNVPTSGFNSSPAHPPLTQVPRNAFQTELSMLGAH